MPKSKKPPKYSKMNKYAVVYVHGKPRYLGLYGSPESHVAYSRFVAELQANPNPILSLSAGEKSVTVRELTAAFLDHAKANFGYTEYSHYRIIVLDFLDKLYGDNFPIEDFKPRCLKLVREEMIQSRRFCRRIVNRYTQRIVSIFAWGVENDLVLEKTWRTLKVVKSVRKGKEGTFDNEERQPVSDDTIRRTLPFMPPTVAAMVVVQRLTGCRPSEIFNMRVGEISKDAASGLWYYIPGSHKTEEQIGKKVIPLGKPEQARIAPYLVGKDPSEAVFSPSTAMKERAETARAKRKSNVPPSQQQRDKRRAESPPNRKIGEIYNRDSYRRAVKYAIDKGNRQGYEIKHWSPYLLRNSAATATELEVGLDESQALLSHTSADMTRRYSKAQLQIRKKLAMSRRDPFGSEVEETES
jgi:integrase